MRKTDYCCVLGKADSWKPEGVAQTAPENTYSVNIRKII